MAKRRPAALVFAGPVSRGSLSRLPGLPEQLQFVKSSSIATASRAVHALKSGTMVRTLEDLSEADLILISVPDDGLAAMIEEMSQAELDWHGRSAVLYDSSSDSRALRPLRERGARVATLNYHPRPEQFLAEGDAEAIRRLRSLAGSKPVLTIQSKAEYIRAANTASTTFYPLMASIVNDLRLAGMDRLAAEKTAAAMIADSARTFLRAGHRLLKKPKRQA